MIIWLVIEEGGQLIYGGYVGVNCNYRAVCDVWSKLIGVTTYWPLYLDHSFPESVQILFFAMATEYISYDNWKRLMIGKYTFLRMVFQILTSCLLESLKRLYILSITPAVTQLFNISIRLKLGNYIPE